MKLPTCPLGSSGFQIMRLGFAHVPSAVYGALDMPWATLVSQISKSDRKQSEAVPVWLC